MYCINGHRSLIEFVPPSLHKYFPSRTVSVMHHSDLVLSQGIVGPGSYDDAAAALKMGGGLF